MSKLDCTAWIAASSPAMTIERFCVRAVVPQQLGPGKPAGRPRRSAMSCHGGVAITRTAGTITGLRTVTCRRMARRPRPAPVRRRAVTGGAAVRRTEQRGADHGAFLTKPPPRSAPFPNAQSAVRTAASPAAAPPSTTTTKRKRPCLAARSDNGRLT
jgi:hypothetical protein